jgi:hypothetical protein
VELARIRCTSYIILTVIYRGDYIVHFIHNGCGTTPWELGMKGSFLFP